MSDPPTAVDAAVHTTVDAAVAFIASHQRADGSIPEAPDGRLDPWDHVECAMALDIGGRSAGAERAYRWLQQAQSSDGSIWAAYRDGEPHDLTKDTNLSSYLAVGLWHHYLLTQDEAFARELWPAARRAIDFVFEMQADFGGIYWARDEHDNVWDDCLVAGSSCVRAAIVCAERLAELLGEPDAARWRERRGLLEVALREREHDFGWSWEGAPKARYAMDWYYPVLCGVIEGREARRRIDRARARFVRPGLGCRCTDVRPWVTVAESAELALALDVVGRREAARQLLDWQLGHQQPDGGFRMGTAPGWGEWPAEQRPSWTAAAVVIAADAVHDLTPAAALFRSLPNA
ncbi:MAG: prenyltransferase/squalene oxidase repeat-containing protein [Dehalococcoidia bacterium]